MLWIVYIVLFLGGFVWGWGLCDLCSQNKTSEIEERNSKKEIRRKSEC